MRLWTRVGDTVRHVPGPLSLSSLDALQEVAKQYDAAKVALGHSRYRWRGRARGCLSLANSQCQMRDSSFFSDCLLVLSASHLQHAHADHTDRLVAFRATIVAQRDQRLATVRLNKPLSTSTNTSSRRCGVGPLFFRVLYFCCYCRSESGDKS